jgi:hypothetical protein
VTGQRSNQLNYVPNSIFIGLAENPHVYWLPRRQPTRCRQSLSRPDAQIPEFMDTTGHHKNCKTSVGIRSKAATVP